MKSVYLIVDIGTGNSRAALITAQGNILDIETFENYYYRDPAYEDAQYFIPKEWENMIIGAVQKLIKANRNVKIQAITSTSARESIVLFNKQGQAFYGLPNVDNRGKQWIDKIGKSGEIYKKTGRWLSEVFSASKLLGLSKVHKDTFMEIDCITSLSEWVGHLFTGKIVIEPSQACETQLFDIKKWGWSQSLCNAFEINPAILPKIKAAGQSIGKVKTEFKDMLGLQENIPFIIGGADTQTAVMGIDIEEGDMAVVSGTTSPVVTLSKTKFYDDRQRCWTDCYIDGCGYQVESNAGVTGLNYQRIKKIFFEDIDYDLLEKKMGEKESIKCVATWGTLIFSENRSLYNGGFYMPAPLDAGCDKYDFALAVIADIACAIFQQYSNLCDMIPHNKDYLLGCGGGFQSGMLCQLLSDLTGKDLIIREGFCQASLLGCVKICNAYYGISSERKQVEKVYKTRKKSIIEDYYVKWNRIRNLIN